MATVLKSPQIGTYDQYETPCIFLAGSIDMGSAIDWQTRMEDSLKDYDVTIFNPRRDDWDSTWEQSIDDPEFDDYFEWEHPYDYEDYSSIIEEYAEDENDWLPEDEDDDNA